MKLLRRIVHYIHLRRIGVAHVRAWAWSAVWVEPTPF